MKELPEFANAKPSEAVAVSDSSIQLIDFYMDMFSLLIKTQQGFTSDVYKNLTQQSTVLKDVKLEPQRVLTTVLDHFIHRITLVDIKGVKDLVDKDTLAMLSKLHSSLLALLRIGAVGEHNVF